jgi:ABC-type antimicrobial peptide transport system permease subunit
VRLALGGTPGSLLVSVLGRGIGIALTGIAAGALIGYGLAGFATAASSRLESPGFWPTAGAALVLVAAAVAASIMPALRASRVDVTQALRTE